MGSEKDMTEKKLESYNDVFADIANVLMFDGEQVIKPDELEQARSSSHYTGDDRLREQERDEAKFWKNHNVRISLIGFENETAGDPDEPIRVIGYDGAGYRDQLYSAKNENGTYTQNNEPRYPVITLVLYFGDKRWSAPKTLYENLGGVSDRLKPFVNDYKINLFEIAFLEEETVNKFKSDFKYVAEFFVHQRKKDYDPDPKEIKYVHEILLLMKYLTKDDTFETVYEESLKGAEKVTMCDVVERFKSIGREEGLEKGREEGLEKGREEGLEKGREEGLEKGREEGLEKGREEGLEKGREEGRAEGRTEGAESTNLSAIKTVMQKLKYSAEQAMDFLNIPASEQPKYAAKL